jgi:endo-1,4-beta-xylanase
MNLDRIDMFRKILAVLAVAAVTCISCKKKTEFIDEYATTDTTGVLKAVSDGTIGVGVKLSMMSSDTAYASLVKKHFNSVTFENEFKNVSIVSNDGDFDYSKADAAVALAQSAGMNIYGHALVDYQSSNNVYLRSLTSNTSEINVVPNAGFENGTGNGFANWGTQVDASASGSWEAETAAPFQGSRSMKVTVVTSGVYQYSIQAYSDLFSVTAGNVYTFTFYAKAATNGSRFKAIIQNATYQEKTIYPTTTWQQYSFTFTANEPSLTIRLHFPAAGVFYFDNFSILKPVSGTNQVDPVKIDNAMKQFITNMVSRYKNSIHAWDVVNEPLAEGGVLRTSAQQSTGNNIFHFADYLGREYIAKALRYAHDADPTALLFINEYRLETDRAKVDSLVKLINELKAAGVPVHGVGIQMHIGIKDDRSGIEYALSRLAETGLKIRISEMDVRVNPWNIFGYRASNDDLIIQRDLYRFAIGAYYRLVPSSQRYGITFWDPADKYSWIIVNQNKEDAPTLLDVNLQKKPAYYGVIVALRKKE